MCASRCIILFNLRDKLKYNYMLQASQKNIIRQQIAEERLAPAPYNQINAYSQKPAFQQILTILLFVTIVTLHAVFITAATVALQNPILWVLVSTTYGLMLIMVYDYCYITCNDPVDDLIIKVPRNYRQKELVDCGECRRRVHFRSHHCQTCKRCVQQFDHHCKYLNNCIGGKNYAQFIRLLMTVTFFCIGVICQGIWIFVQAQDDQKFRQSIISYWGALVTSMFALIAMAAVDSLLFFHFYLIFSLKMTTYDYIKKGWQEQQRQVEEHRKRAAELQKTKALELERSRAMQQRNT